jgi:mannose/fructose/sorbose-specific phosphotransferase system IIA component
MVSIVLASHGAFAEGIKQSGQMIFGPQEAVEAVVLTPEMGPEDLRAKILDAIATFENQEEVLFLVDLWGGTPFNQISLLLEEPGHEKWVAVTGLNLPMVLAAYGERFGDGSAADIAKARAAHPEAVVMVHPECPAEVRAAADEALSTGGMCAFAKSSPAKEFIVGTETGILHRLRKENPGKNFYPVREDMVCRDMKKMTLEKLYSSLAENRFAVQLPQDVADRAKLAIDAMLKL